ARAQFARVGFGVENANAIELQAFGAFWIDAKETCPLRGNRVAIFETSPTAFAGQCVEFCSDAFDRLQRVEPGLFKLNEQMLAVSFGFKRWQLVDAKIFGSKPKAPAHATQRCMLSWQFFQHRGLRSRPSRSQLKLGMPSNQGPSALRQLLEQQLALGVSQAV